MRSPTSRRRSTSHVAPRAVAHGIAADVVLPQPRPRAPCGPSVTHMRGLPRRSIFVVDMKSEPVPGAARAALHLGTGEVPRRLVVPAPQRAMARPVRIERVVERVPFTPTPAGVVGASSGALVLNPGTAEPSPEARGRSVAIRGRVPRGSRAADAPRRGRGPRRYR